MKKNKKLITPKYFPFDEKYSSLDYSKSSNIEDALSSIAPFPAAQITKDLFGEYRSSFDQVGSILGKQSFSVSQQMKDLLGEYQSSFDQVGTALAKSTFSTATSRIKDLLNFSQIAIDPLVNTSFQTVTDQLLQSFDISGSNKYSNINIDSLLGELKVRNFDIDFEAGEHEFITAYQTPATDRIEEPKTEYSKNNILANIPTLILIFIIQAFYVTYDVVAKWEDFRQGLVDINERMPKTESFSTIRKFIRNELSGKPEDFRLVSSSRAVLRIKPSMKSDIILSLSEKDVVIVLEKSDRTWLYVAYEHQGFLIKGYISTKFLKKVN